MSDVLEPRYPLTWDLRREDPPVSADFCEASDRGGCDAAILLSFVYVGGAFCLDIKSLDGRTGEAMPDEEVFKAWAILAHHLSESATLAPGQIELARSVHEYVKRIVMMGRDGGGA